MKACAQVPHPCWNYYITVESVAAAAERATRHGGQVMHGPAEVPGGPRFVSSERIGAGLNRLSWSSTTHFLSVLVAPRFAPARLVVDPEANYFWRSCATATTNEKANRAIPVESRRLVRTYSCLHR
jgi:hypothetical protein